MSRKSKCRCKKLFLISSFLCQLHVFKKKKKSILFSCFRASFELDQFRVFDYWFFLSKNSEHSSVDVTVYRMSSWHFLLSFNPWISFFKPKKHTKKFFVLWIKLIWVKKQLYFFSYQLMFSFCTLFVHESFSKIRKKRLVGLSWKNLMGLRNLSISNHIKISSVFCKFHWIFHYIKEAFIFNFFNLLSRMGPNSSIISDYKSSKIFFSSIEKETAFQINHLVFVFIIINIKIVNFHGFSEKNSKLVSAIHQLLSEFHTVSKEKDLCYHWFFYWKFF